MGRTLQDVISEWVVKFNSREIGKFFSNFVDIFSSVLLFFLLVNKNAIIEIYKLVWKKGHSGCPRNTFMTIEVNIKMICH